MKPVAALLLQVALVAAGAPLLVGLMRQVRARLEGRAGAGVLQPWRDLRKLARREPISPPGSGVFFIAAPPGKRMPERVCSSSQSLGPASDIGSTNRISRSTESASAASARLARAAG